MRNYFFGANWKMNMSIQDAQDFFQNWKYPITSDQTTLVFFPTQHILGYLQENYGSQYLFGAQNTTYHSKGAYTGEITPELIKADHIPFTLIGHSERRTLFHETDKDVQLKIQACLKYGLKVVLCIGEPLSIREESKHISFIQKQLQSALHNIALSSSENLVIAYEPVWAIGTGKTASTEQIDEMHTYIRKEIEKYDLLGETIPIIYGGSVNKNNAQEILSIPNVNGALIGGASLDPKSLWEIICSIQ